MEDLQLEQKLDWLCPVNNKFKATFIEPVYLTIENKLQFENLFDLQEPESADNVY